MRRRPSRLEVQEALSPALIAALGGLKMHQDATTLCRTIRALVEIAFDLAESGSCPPTIMVEQLQRVARRRLRRLKSGEAVWLMVEAKA